MTGAQVAAVVVLGVVAWVGLALCVVVAVVLSIREAQRRRVPVRKDPEPTVTDDVVVVWLSDRRGSRVDVRL